MRSVPPCNKHRVITVDQLPLRGPLTLDVEVDLGKGPRCQLTSSHPENAGR